MCSNIIMFIKVSALFLDLKIDFWSTAKAIAIYSCQLSNFRVSLFESFVLFVVIIYLFIFVIFKCCFEEYLFAGVSSFSWSGVLNPQGSGVYLPGVLQHL